jgi:hypothetical protein
VTRRSIPPPHDHAHHSESKMQLNNRDLPNYGVIEGKLPDVTVAYLWTCVEDAKQLNLSMNSELVGNISRTLVIEDKKKMLSTILSDLITRYQQVYRQHFRLMKTGTSEYNFELDKLWVNFQKQNEFNPTHDHAGAVSFVVWMKIPIEYEEQRELAISKNSDAPSAISNFEFSYTEILGNIRTYTYVMNSLAEGTIVFFPAELHHQVYPYFNCDEERVSISGNISIKFSN